MLRLKYTVKKRYRKIEPMLDTLKKYDDYFRSYDEQAAKQALINFFQKLKTIKSDNDLIISTNFHANYYSFYINVIPIMQALKEKRYSNACNEILTLNHNHPILQERIYSALLYLYDKYLEVDYFCLKP